MEKAKASIIARKRKRLYKQLLQNSHVTSDEWVERSSPKKPRLPKTSHQTARPNQYNTHSPEIQSSKEKSNGTQYRKNNTYSNKNNTETVKKQLHEKNLSNLQNKLQEQLKGGKFRWINEQLYTTRGDDAFQLFQAEPELFRVYHEGFQSQVNKWPENPLDVFINYVTRSKEPLVIGDFGCGEANLAKACDEAASKGGTRHAVYSFDLVAENDFITACDIANVPLPHECLDLAIFCLSLMGTNFMDFLKEAHRVLKPGAQLKIAEVKSRISDVQQFVNSLATAGFKLVSKDERNKMFILFDFTKTTPKVEPAVNKRMNKKGLVDQSQEPVLKPCLYKRR